MRVRRKRGYGEFGRTVTPSGTPILHISLVRVRTLPTTVTFPSTSISGLDVDFSFHSVPRHLVRGVYNRCHIKNPTLVLCRSSDLVLSFRLTRHWFGSRITSKDNFKHRNLFSLGYRSDIQFSKYVNGGLSFFTFYIVSFPDPYPPRV